MDASVRDYDIEAFQNADYGANFMEQLGDLTGGKGKYVQFVGSLTSVSHNEWCDAADKVAEEKFPDMENLDVMRPVMILHHLTIRQKSF